MSDNMHVRSKLFFEHCIATTDCMMFFNKDEKGQKKGGHICCYVKNNRESFFFISNACCGIYTILNGQLNQRIPQYSQEYTDTD